MIVLDTHAWLWWADNPEKLSPKARSLINSTPDLGVSVVSCWEVAMLSARGRVDLGQPVRKWIDNALRPDAVRLLPLSVEAAILSGSQELNWDHKDPADRMIVATAIEYDEILVTADHAIHAFADIQTVW